MGGGLMQLVAYGAQDIYLTGNPQITFFKVVYRRHTNFAVESIEQTFNGQADFGNRVTATISRNGDLIQQIYLEIVLPAATGSSTSNLWVYGIGNALIQQVELEIGGQLIDRQYGSWMNIWSELTTPAAKRAGYDNMVGNNKPGAYQAGSIDAGNGKKRLYVPLQFWFNRNPGLALPLIALQYHEVKLNLWIMDLAKVYAGTTNATLQCKMYVDYVYLDTDERRRFAQVSHEYLIEQVQYTGAQSISQGTTSYNSQLNYNHPVKELIWVHTTSTNAALSGGTSCFNYSGDNSGFADTFTTGLLQLNGHDRFSVRFADYFRKVQNYEHHTRVPRVGADLDVNDNRYQYIYSYSFALSPEEHQPSGTCNFSRIDNAVMQFGYGVDSVTGAAAVPALASGSLSLQMYAVNYNVLRIMSGMGGLAYSN